MRVGNVSLLIPEGKELDSGHVELAHGSVYRITLMNHCYNRRCDATVEVDGKEVGCFRLERGGEAVLERPVNDTGRFTFFKADSPEAESAGVAGISKDSRGLVQVRFKPEKVQLQPVQHTNARKGAVLIGSTLRSSHARSASTPDLHDGCFFEPCSNSSSPKDVSAGVTGLTGKSDQRFYSVVNLDYDPLEEVVISIRLVCETSVRPLQPVVKSNPVPELVV